MANPPIKFRNDKELTNRIFRKELSADGRVISRDTGPAGRRNHRLPGCFKTMILREMTMVRAAVLVMFVSSLVGTVAADEGKSPYHWEKITKAAAFAPRDGAGAL